MKVYVVVGYIDYEGYNKPSKVFDSEQKAKDYIANYKLTMCDGIEYFELEVE